MVVLIYLTLQVLFYLGSPCFLLSDSLLNPLMILGWAWLGRGVAASLGGGLALSERDNASNGS